MPGVNRVQLIGRLGADPEHYTTAGGKPICKFRVATDSGFGEKKVTEWHHVVTFDKLAETCRQYLSKGRLVYVEGRIHYSRWAKPDGSVVNLTEITAHDVQFLGGGERAEGGAPAPYSPNGPGDVGDYGGGFGGYGAGEGKPDDMPF